MSYIFSALNSHLTGKIAEEVRKTIIVQSERLDCEVVELNIQPEHVH
jgi:REP element-mobilizing transposase RayT